MIGTATDFALSRIIAFLIQSREISLSMSLKTSPTITYYPQPKRTAFRT